MKTPKKIAIIGTGISGMAAAYGLNPYHDISIYEKNAYVGGHSRTVNVKTPDGSVPVDTGFIVMNRKNYPLLTRLFEHLNVPLADSNMSFGSSIDGSWLEYSTQNLAALFAQKRNLLRFEFWSMLFDILKFNASAKRFMTSDPSLTLGKALDLLGMKSWFKSYFLLPMGAAIWSSPIANILDFPASTFIRFFENHGLLTISDHPQWLTVKGGSREYVKRLIAPFEKKIRLNCGVESVRRMPEAVSITDSSGRSECFQEVVFACHADQALSMIKDPSQDELSILGAFHYQSNRTILHQDLKFMPKERKAWASWVYLSEQKKGFQSNVSLSYWMNNLQPLDTKTSLFVTLNPGKEPQADLIHDEHHFEHPILNEPAIRSQDKIQQIQGCDRFWFCGAYQRYGFHEDGLSSAVTMLRQMGVDIPWA